jgi:hypothetical protein
LSKTKEHRPLGVVYPEPFMSEGVVTAKSRLLITANVAGQGTNRGMSILPGITNSWIRNPLEEWLIPPGVTNSWTRYPLEEWLFRRESPTPG